MTAFCNITGDINPLHMDVNFSRSHKFKDRVVYGMLTSSFYSTLVGVYLPGKYGMLQGINIKFNKPVFIGDKLNIVGAVSFISESVKVIEIKAKIINQEGGKISSAKITAGFFQ